MNAETVLIPVGVDLDRRLPHAMESQAESPQLGGLTCSTKVSVAWALAHAKAKYLGKRGLSPRDFEFCRKRQD